MNVLIVVTSEGEYLHEYLFEGRESHESVGTFLFEVAVEELNLFDRKATLHAELSHTAWPIAHQVDVILKERNL